MATQLQPVTPSTEIAPINRARSVLKFDERKAELAELAKQSVRIVEITNKAGRDECHAAMMDLANARIDIQKTGKDARDDATKFSKAVIGAEKDLIAIVEPEEERLRKLRDGWDNAREAERAEKARIEREKIEAAERARIEAERAEQERVQREQAEALAKERAELDRQRKELEAAQTAQRETERKERDADNNAMQEIQGIRQQVTIARIGRLGVRTGGTLECMRETLAETEAWVIDERFRGFVAVAQSTKDAVVLEIQNMIAHAEQVEKDKEERQRIQAEREELDRKQAEQRRIAQEEEDRRAAAERKRLDDEATERREKAERDRAAAAQKRLDTLKAKAPALRVAAIAAHHLLTANGFADDDVTIQLGFAIEKDAKPATKKAV